MGEKRMFGRQDAGVQHYVEFDLRLNRWVPLCGQYMVNGDIEASSKPFYANEPVCTNCREKAGELKRVVFRVDPILGKALEDSGARRIAEMWLSVLAGWTEADWDEAYRMVFMDRARDFLEKRQEMLARYTAASTKADVDEEG